MGGAGARGTPGDASLTPVSFLLSAVLGKAVHSLSRIGDELYLEPLEDGVRGWVGLQPRASFSSRQVRCLWAELSTECVPRSPLSGRPFGPCHLPRPVCEWRAIALPEVPGGGWGQPGRKGKCADGCVGLLWEQLLPDTQGRLREEGTRWPEGEGGFQQAMVEEEEIRTSV